MANAFKSPKDLAARDGYSVDFSGKNAPLRADTKMAKRNYMEKLRDEEVEQIRGITADLEPGVIKNVLAYTRQLVKPGTNEIDENIFMAQMAKHFKISDNYLILRIFEVIKAKKKSASVLNYAKLICIYICETMHPKIEYAFRVYDVRGCGQLNTYDLETALKPLIRYTHIVIESETISGAEAEDTEGKMLNEIVNLLLFMIDTNNDRSIDLGEFRAIVSRHPLMLECLGPCLPNKKERDEFMMLMTDKSPFEVSAYFRHERKVSLNDPSCDKSLFDTLYPFQLEFP